MNATGAAAPVFFSEMLAFTARIAYDAEDKTE